MPSQPTDAVIPAAPPLMIPPRDIALDQRSITLVVAPRAEAAALRRYLSGPRTLATPDVRIVLDDVRLGSAGGRGGYFYKLYVNLPRRGTGSARARDYLVGTLGPFEIAAIVKEATYTGAKTVRFSLPVGQALRAQGYAGDDDLRLSFVRVSAPTSPQGDVILIGEARVEVGALSPGGELR